MCSMMTTPKREATTLQVNNITITMREDLMPTTSKEEVGAKAVIPAGN